VEHRAAGKLVSAVWLAERLAGPAQELGVEIGSHELELLARYAGLVLDWGSRINLTGARTPEALADEHLADALAALPHLPGGPFRFIDVGSGAGLPGLVLALVRGDASGVLLEPIRKKHAFLAYAARELGLAGRVEARAERLEMHLAGGAGASYDVAISRATWPAASWLVRGRPLARPGGRVYGFEGSTPGELPAGARRHPYTLGRRKRALVVLEA
jgi:16S rRNA (guanine527-N7)-methyltransferase